MKSIVVAIKDFSIRIKDRRAFMMMILMPIVLTIILGSALKGVMGDSSSAPKTIIALYQQDQHPLSKQFVQGVLENTQLKNSIVVKNVYSQKELNQFIHEKKADVGVVLPKNWGTQLANGKTEPVTIKVSDGKDFEANFVQQLTESYVKTTNAVTASAKMVLSDLASQGKSGKELKSIGAGLTNNLGKEAEANASFVYDKPVGKNQVSSLQYYAAAMAAMFLLFNAMVGGKSILSERANLTLSRMMISPTDRVSIMTGKFLGTFLYTMVQFLIFLGATHYIIQVNWGSNPGQIIMIAIAYSISVSGLSMIVAAFMKTEKTADSLGGMLVQVLSLLGGSMIPISVFPETLQKISKITPNSWALNSFTNIMSGTSWNSLIIPLCILIGIGIIATIIGSLRFRMISN